MDVGLLRVLCVVR